MKGILLKYYLIVKNKTKSALSSDRPINRRIYQMFRYWVFHFPDNGKRTHAFGLGIAPLTNWQITPLVTSFGREIASLS